MAVPEVVPLIDPPLEAVQLSVGLLYSDVFVTLTVTVAGYSLSQSTRFDPKSRVAAGKPRKSFGPA
ncbi:hypothetical protein GCM10023187_57120 [Nibrella viscosa]|uniref:Uncharacterized protein n=1 Tax=Nibrella viscosa TaxID=1084524 RepID=A0ABP8L3C2_9BACT